MERTERQLQIIKKWKNNKGKGTVVAATGFGKTYLGILSIQAVQEKFPGATTIIVVPRIPLKDDWEKEIEKYGLKNVEVYVVNTAAKLGKVYYTHKVLDELHNFIDGKEFSKVLHKIQSKTAMGLTAKIENPPFKIIDRVSKKECLDNGWVSDHENYNLAVPLTDGELEEYRRINKTFKKYESLLGGRFEAFSKASAYRKFIYIKKNRDDFVINKYSNKVKKRNKIKEDETGKYRELTDKEVDIFYNKGKMAKIYFQEMNKRKKILCSSYNKALAAKEIVEKLPERKGIVFSEHTNFADTVHSFIENSYIYHSKRTDKQNREALKGFDESDSGVIISAKSLNEGVDVPDCSLGIIAAGNSKELDNIQREGRTIRAREGKRSLIINLYIPETQDEKWLEKRQGDNAIYVNSVDEILDYEEKFNKT